MALTSKFSVSLSFVQTAAPDLGQGRVEQAISFAASLANGTANGQADLAFVDERTLASNTSEDLDLAGVLAGAFGATLTFVEVCAVAIESLSANTTNLTIGAASAEALLWFGATGDTEIIKPGGVAAHYAPAGWTIGAGSTDDLKIANASGAAATYRIGVLGRSA